MQLPGMHLMGRTPTSLARQVKDIEIADLRREFRKEVQSFIREAGIP